VAFTRTRGADAGSDENERRTLGVLLHTAVQNERGQRLFKKLG
jgi:hypothetical protein